MTENDNSNNIISNSPVNIMPASYINDEFDISDYDYDLYDVIDDLDSEYMYDFTLNNNFIDVIDLSESDESDESDESE